MQSIREIIEVSDRNFVIGAAAAVVTILYMGFRRRAAEKRAYRLQQVSRGLQQSEERFSQMAENIDQVFWIQEPGASIYRYISPAYTNIWGRAPLRLYEDSAAFLETVHTEDREKVQKFLKRQNAGSAEEVFRIVRPDGGVRWIHNRSFPIRDASGAIYRITGVAVDVTKERTLEVQLRQAQKMEAIGQLAGGVAHDFNNLLTVIRGYAQVMSNSVPGTHAHAELLSEIIKASDQAAQLTSRLLVMSRRHVPQPKLLDLNEVVGEMKVMLRRAVDESIDLRVKWGEGLWKLKADRVQVEEIVLNLAVNAREAMPNGGTMTIETANIPAGADTGDVSLDPGDYVLLEVTDTGCGIDEALKGRIFEPFFTTKEPGKGAGLGLSTVYGIVKQSHGEIAVSSTPGNGTTFRIYFPRVLGVEEEDIQAAPITIVRRPEIETILLVEDEEAVCKVTSMTLRSAGYAVLEARSVGEAISVFERCGNDIKLLLTDVIMPTMNGPALAKMLCPLNPKLKVLYMSGYPAACLSIQGEAEIDLIQKPFTPNGLIQHVARVLYCDSDPARILVADDEAAVRKTLRKMLEGAGFHVEEAINGREAVQCLLKGKIDLFITDLVMPEQEGIETIRLLRQGGTGVKIIAISGAFGGHYLEAAGHVGADAVLPKPIRLNELLETIEKVLGTGRRCFPREKKLEFSATM